MRSGTKVAVLLAALLFAIPVSAQEATGADVVASCNALGLFGGGHRLVIVEGIETYRSSSYWRGGNLQGVAANPVRLVRPNRVVYAAQDFSRTAVNPPPGNTPKGSEPSVPFRASL